MKDLSRGRAVEERRQFQVMGPHVQRPADCKEQLVQGSQRKKGGI